MTKTLGEFTHPQGESRNAPRALRILIADDERDSVLTLMMLLRNEGHEVRGTYSGERVMETLRAFEADVVILDIAMPHRTGFELARGIRERYAIGGPMLIAVTGKYIKESDKILAELTGFDHLLTKPYLPSALLALIEPLRWPSENASPP